MVVSIAGVVTLLLARGHYSIDVIIAYWITTRIWWMFHTIANNENLKEVGGFGENENNYLKKVIRTHSNSIIRSRVKIEIYWFLGQHKYFVFLYRYGGGTFSGISNVTFLHIYLVNSDCLCRKL